MPTDVVRAPNHDRERSLGWLALDWMEALCVHGPGDIQGTPLTEIPLTADLAGLNLDCYALDEDGHRLYDSVFYSRPKGADKSGHAARIALFEALGPCRFAGWAKGGEIYEFMDFRYVYQPGEPMGRPVTYPFLRILATEEGQTGNVYDAVHFNLTEGPLSQAFKKRDDVGLTRVYLPDGGEIRPSTASSSAKDGGKETWTNFDETHLYTLPELRRMYATVRRNMAKRRAAESWSFESSTMYEPGLDSIAERTHDYAQKIKAGKAADTRLLFDHRQAPEGVNLEDPAEIRAALIESYGDSASYVPLDRMVSEIRDDRNEITDSLRFFFNQATAGAIVWLPIEEWRERADPDHEVPPGALITLGFDGSTRRDATALVATEIDTGFQWPIAIWERPERADEWEVPYDDVDAAVAFAFEQYDVWRMYCDPRWWETRIAAWAGKYGDKKVLEWHTNRPRPMAAALLAYHNAITSGDLTHNGDETMAQHIGNAVRHREGFSDDMGAPMVTIRKERQDSPRKMDAAMAGCLSWEARNDAVAAGAKKAGPPRVTVLNW